MEIVRMANERSNKSGACFPVPGGNGDHAARAHAIIAGYGLPGRALAERLRELGIPFCVIERNIDVVRRCGRGGVKIIQGDATSEETLRQAGIESAILFAATMPNDSAVLEAVTMARKLNGHIRIFARCEYISNGLKATRRGANEVVVAEEAVAREFAKLPIVVQEKPEDSAEQLARVENP